MRLLGIELVGYTRVMSNTVNVLRMNLTQKIQLILGTNGSGKSSLMSELTPLPANGDDFHKGGSKTITISHHGNHYTLINRFDTKKGWHSFVRNGEELNLSHLQTTQFELCQQEFGYNENIRKLLQGKIKFSQMGPKARREWLTLLSDVDFDYAIGVYDRLRKEAAASAGFLRRQRERLVVEQQKIITTEEQQRLKSEAEAIHQELSKLLAVRKPIDHNLPDLETKQQAGLKQLEEMSSTLMRMRIHAPLSAYGGPETYRDEWGQLQAPTFNHPDQIETYIQRLRERLAAHEAILNQAVKDHTQVQDTLKVLKQTGDDGLKSLSEKLNQLINEKQQILAKRRFSLEFDNSRQALLALEASRDLLIDTFSRLPENEDKRFSQVSRERYLGERKSLQETLHTYRGGLDRLQAQKDHQEQHLQSGQVECPTCHTRFAPGYSEHKLKEIKDAIERGTTKSTEVDGKLKSVEGKLEEIDGYASLYRQYSNCVKGYPALAAFWRHLEQENIPLSAPRMVLTLVGQIEQDLKWELKAEEIQQEIDSTKHLMHQATLVGNATLLETQTKAAEIEVMVEQITDYMQFLRAKIAEHHAYHQQLKEAFALGEKIKSLEKNLAGLTETIIDTMWMETIHHCIRQLQSQLLRKEETLNEVKQQLLRVKDLEEQIAVEMNKEKALDIVIETLSPKDGMIAEGLLGFIKSFVRQMNGLIKRIWTYPLAVKECGIMDGSGVELDYKFPLVTFNAGLVVDDISNGSDGQVSVVDLAFTTVAMKYLGLAESPLYLDEPAKAFDNEHKKTAMEAFKTLMETTAFTQLFMISHDYQNYSSFANVDVCVLDSKNIVVPDRYNDHVTIQ